MKITLSCEGRENEQMRQLIQQILEHADYDDIEAELIRRGAHKTRVECDIAIPVRAPATLIVMPEGV